MSQQPPQLMHPQKHPAKQQVVCDLKPLHRKPQPHRLVMLMSRELPGVMIHPSRDVAVIAVEVPEVRTQVIERKKS